LRPKSDVVVTMYTVRRDGMDWRCLGNLPSTPDNASTYDNHFFGLCWLPNGKEISFIYHDKLWKTSADLP